ncbi:hypothetical protein QFC20_007590 [Naganishia adeliensis]|uniref:Uncharacterized protein n=1 Tax=Naganishia adeliensis TaxID=92952 RepID=A0ACC2UXE1_9TREE|nr:hypothetical protein QFC20_007590 [Naganishia adeliensis]
MPLNIVQRRLLYHAVWLDPFPPDYESLVITRAYFGQEWVRPIDKYNNNRLLQKHIPSGPQKVKFVLICLRYGYSGQEALRLLPRTGSFLADGKILTRRNADVAKPMAWPTLFDASASNRVHTCQTFHSGISQNLPGVVSLQVSAQ